MAVKTINIKDADVPEMIEVYGEDYQTEVIDEASLEVPKPLIPNPQTKAQYANEQLTFHLRESIRIKVLRYRRKLLAQTLNTTDITEG